MPRPRVHVDWDTQPLGQLSDTALAARLKCSVSTVQRERNLRKIEAYKPAHGRNGGRPPTEWSSRREARRLRAEWFGGGGT